MKISFPSPCLMLVTDRKLCRMSLLSAIEQAVGNGADIIQLREKDLPPEDLLPLAKSIRKAVKGRALFIVNGNARVALDSEADGVHLPEDGPATEKARAILGKQLLIGRSAHSAAGAIKSEISGADYIILGTIYATDSKPGKETGGMGLMAETAESVKVPTLAIGGIVKERVPELLQAGAAGIAVCSAILGAANPSSACRELRSALDTAFQASAAQVKPHHRKLHGQHSR